MNTNTRLKMEALRTPEKTPIHDMRELYLEDLCSRIHAMVDLGQVSKAKEELDHHLRAAKAQALRTALDESPNNGHPLEFFQMRVTMLEKIRRLVGG